MRVVSVSRPEEGPPLPVWFPYDLRCHWGLEAFKPWTVGSLDQVAGQCDSESFLSHSKSHRVALSVSG